MRLKQYLQEINESKEDGKIHAKRYTPEEAAKIPPFSKAVAQDVYKITKGDKYVIIDNKDGLVAVPINQSILYHGFVASCSVSKFLELALDDEGTKDKTAKEIVELLEQGYAIASPWFWFDIDVGKDDPLMVWDHEGRSRMKAIKLYFGGDPIVPVQFYLKGGKLNRHVTPEVIKKMEDGFVLPQNMYGHTFSDPKTVKIFTIGKNTFKDIVK